VALCISRYLTATNNASTAHGTPYILSKIDDSSDLEIEDLTDLGEQLPRLLHYLFFF